MPELAKRILIIDDDPQVLQVVSEFLHRSGYAVWNSTNGEKGLKLATTFKPDLVLCDLQMPVMNGWDFTRQLRAIPGLADIPVIFLSAVTDRAEVRRSMNCGGDDFLNKPLNLQEIAQTVMARLQRRQHLEERQAQRTHSALAIFAGLVDTNPRQLTGEAADSDPARAVTPSEGPGNGHFMAEVNHRRMFVKYTELKAILAYGEYSQAFWGPHKVLFRKPLKQWLRELPLETFVRIHRQSIINLRYFDFLESDPHGHPQVHLKDFGTVLPVSQRCAPQLNRRLKYYQPA
ncbi:MAG TPA: response regulator transcription factor [Verrucomicrobiae bacterium]